MGFASIRHVNLYAKSDNAFYNALSLFFVQKSFKSLPASPPLLFLFAFVSHTSIKTNRQIIVTQ